MFLLAASLRGASPGPSAAKLVHTDARATAHVEDKFRATKRTTATAEPSAAEATAKESRKHLLWTDIIIVHASPSLRKTAGWPPTTKP